MHLKNVDPKQHVCHIIDSEFISHMYTVQFSCSHCCAILIHQKQVLNPVEMLLLVTMLQIMLKDIWTYQGVGFFHF